MNNYELKKQNKIERYEELAKNAECKSNALFGQHQKMASVIPFGQPILIGHHSEGRDRNYRRKIENKAVASFKEQKKSEYYKEKAAATANNTAISSDDPEAITKLKAKISDMEKARKNMTDTNKAWRTYAKKKDKKPLYNLGFTDALIEKLEIDVEKAYSWSKQPYPAYMLSNLSGNLRTTKQRLEKLESRRSRKTESIEIGDMKIVDNIEENRVQLFFPGKPDQEIRARLKRSGFRWSPNNGCWQAYPNYTTKRLISELIKEHKEIN